MAEGYRRSSRPVKIKKEAGFVYNEDSERILAHSDSQLTDGSVSQEESVKVLELQQDPNIFGKDTPDSLQLDWSDIYNVPVNSFIAEVEVYNHNSAEGSGSQSLVSQQDIDQLTSGQCVDISGRGDSGRRNSSTRFSYLDFTDPFLSVSTEGGSISSSFKQNMECVCGSGSLATECCNVEGVLENGASGGMNAKEFKELLGAVGTIKEISEAVKDLKKQVAEQNKEIKNLKASSSVDSSSSDIRSHSSKQKASKSKADRSKEEKERQLRLIKDKLKDKEQESSESEEASDESDDPLNLRELKKKLSKKKKRKSKKREEDLLKKAGAQFPSDDGAATSSSGTDSEFSIKCCKKKKS